MKLEIDGSTCDHLPFRGRKHLKKKSVLYAKTLKLTSSNLTFLVTVRSNLQVQCMMSISTVQRDSHHCSFEKEQFMPLASILWGCSVAGGNFNSSFVLPELLWLTWEFGLTFFWVWEYFCILDCLGQKVFSFFSFTSLIGIIKILIIVLCLKRTCRKCMVFFKCLLSYNISWRSAL